MTSPIDTNQPDHIVDMHEMVTDTDQASEDIDRILFKYEIGFVTHGKDVNVHLANFKKELNTIIRTEKLKLLDELDKSMPTAEQLTTEYGYHMPDKQYGYKLGLHDIREAIEAERDKLNRPNGDVR